MYLLYEVLFCAFYYICAKFFEWKLRVIYNYYYKIRICLLI
jgi:hypothetical protein